jgi:hypothetical protein
VKLTWSGEFMLKLSVKTKLDPLDALERAETYFDGHFGLEIIERRVHLHGKEGAIDIGTSGRKIIVEAEYDSNDVLRNVVDYIREHYGLKAETFSLHFHGELGYVNVTVTNEKPAEATLEGREYDYQIKEFTKKSLAVYIN